MLHSLLHSPFALAAKFFFRLADIGFPAFTSIRHLAAASRYRTAKVTVPEALTDYAEYCHDINMDITLARLPARLYQHDTTPPGWKAPEYARTLVEAASGDAFAGISRKARRSFDKQCSTGANRKLQSATYRFL